MAAPLIGGLLWGIGSALGLVVTKIYDMFFKVMAEKYAYRATIGTAFVIAVGAMTVALAGVVKAIVVGARISMPNSLGASTYFLPSNINVIIAAYVMARLAVYVYEWTLRNMDRFYGAGA